ncbi:hypothetical protein VKT23_004902 [Stygiomarasmius scandens]|uniref:Cyclohexanone monooxygenase n=1 Tax=Marasmiellus scandens TaxID=2682957 RepID=A0ABR1JSG4_9AGAR
MTTDQSAVIDLDALIIGAGFGGIHLLYRLRKIGLKAKIFEAGDNLGGTWFWNTYPGARVDTELPAYQFSLPELYHDWTFTEKYPDFLELQAYFSYVDQKFDLRKDIFFKSKVKEASWDEKEGRWTAITEDGKVAKAKLFLMCTGIGSKHYIPDIKGLDLFKGECHHTAHWPKEQVDWKGKRVGVIGTGASGVQVIQEIAPDAGHLTVFQRTPNMALPMRQQKVSKDTQDKMKKELYPVTFRWLRQTFSGFPFHLVTEKGTMDATPEERRMFWETLWELGGLRLWGANYADILINQAANDEIYAFWREKTRDRLKDERMKDKLAPMVPPHPFGTKRPSLEQTYYEVFNRSNVMLVDLNETPIDEITDKGVKCMGGIEHKLDILVLATGFDAVTGGITAIDIRGTDGESIGHKWEDGVETYLGMAATTYPNMFFLYGPQSPSGFSNGPNSVEIQSDWILDCIKYMLDNGYKRVEVDKIAEAKWTKWVTDMTQHTLFLLAKSWYMGANIPGKKIQPINFGGGVPLYIARINEVAQNGYEGLVFSKELHA